MSIKSFRVTSTSSFSHRHLTVIPANTPATPLLYIDIHSGLSGSPDLVLHTEAPKGPQVASVKLHSFSRKFQITTSTSTTELKGTGFTQKAYSISINGQPLTWKRTHDHALGASRISSRDFKLVDDAGAVLATFVATLGLGREEGELTIMADFGPEGELIVIAGVLAIEEKVQRSQRSSNGGGGGGGA